MKNKLSGISDLSQNELQSLNDSLKRAVVRLASVAKSDNVKLNLLLDEIKRNVKNRLDLAELDTGLDKIFLLINKQDASEQIMPAPVSAPQFHRYLKSSIGKYDLSSLKDTYKSAIDRLIDSHLSDDKLSEKILQLIDKMSIEINTLADTVNEQRKNVQYFQNNIKKALSIDLEIKEMSDTKSILDELSMEISNYVKPDKGMHNAAIKSDNINKTEQNINLLDSFTVLLDSLETASADKKNKDELIKMFSSAGYDAASWKINIKKLATLINEDIYLLQQDKKDLSNFINMFAVQLSDIEAYVEQTRIGREDTANSSLQLRQSLDSNVSKIQNEVGIARDISQLKENVQKHLNTIKVNIARHKQEEAETEKILVGKYDSIMKELVRSRKQTESLRKQLDDSKRELLRDTLTGVPNRLAYNERVATEFNRWKRTGEPLCLAMWDIDHFKNINDTYGHDAGDRVLKLFAKIIPGRVRKVDLFARMGGEEFLLMMPATSITTALDLNNKLLRTLEKYKFHYKGNLCPVTASVGIAEFEDGLNEEEVLKRADKALYISKNSGRNQCTVFQNN